MAIDRSSSALRSVARKTARRCHLCRGRIGVRHYGRLDVSTGWECDHCRARALGGSDARSNLLPAHPWCNRSRQERPASDVRRSLATRKPLSLAAQRRVRRDHVVVGALGGGLATGALAYLLLPAEHPQRALLAIGFGVAGAGVGAAIGHSLDVE